MKNILKPSLLLIIISILIYSCASTTSPGTKIKEPLSGSKYQSNGKFWRAVGNGTSSQQNIAKAKAISDAKKNLAGSVKSRMKVVSDQYLAETSNGEDSDLADKFQSLTREVVNQDIAELREIGNETYKTDEGKYLSYMAYEIKKKEMWKFFKKEIKLQKKYDAQTIKMMEAMIDGEVKKLEALENEE